MNIKEAWEVLAYTAYKCDNEEWCENSSEEQAEQYREAEAKIKALVEANS